MKKQGVTHLSGQHNVVYGADDDIDNVLNKQYVSSSKFLAWMSRNQNDEKARKLSYVEFPTKYVWKLKDRCWEPRKIGRLIGQIHSVSPALGEAYFLRILLNKVKGPKCFEDIRTVNGQTLPTFRDAYFALGLLDDDLEYIELSNTLSRPDFVWEKTWEFLSDGILRARQKRNICQMNKDVFLMKLSKLSMVTKEVFSLSMDTVERVKDFYGRHYQLHYDLKETKLIIWDEAPMVHKHAFEALDRTLEDIFNCDTSKNSETPFGGKVIVFVGDFRQLLPVVPNGSRQQIVNASLSSSYLWSKCEILRLTKNMRLTIGANTYDM
ncbi:uncharacterized protein LOC110870547 [Helianthus annuus]|uniref:uncharacterized protein LOC110870547 n=1 Tax=Helianthus annuus TaxID=4232 RepID=UPI000B8FC8AF|nr:uncharacterized protein LOC110870547 [Helianthus annuus]